MKKTALIAAVGMILSIGCLANEAHNAPHWDYDAHGPAHWGEFGEICAKGQAQSPINILTNQTNSLESVNGIVLNESVKTKAAILDNGHAIQANVENGGTLSVDGKEYKLLQFHFHGKSEEQIDGKQMDLVAHMVHKNSDGQLAVIAVLFNEGKESNRMIQSVLDNVGKAPIEMNPDNLLPKQKDRYFHFMGSLTTPPCSENVKWYVMKEVQTATKAQIEAMRKFYANNYRPVQPLNGRRVQSK